MYSDQQGHLAVADVDFRELLEFLVKNGKRIWVAPVVEVAQRIIDWREENGFDV